MQSQTSNVISLKAAEDVRLTDEPVMSVFFVCRFDGVSVGANLDQYIPVMESRQKPAIMAI